MTLLSMTWSILSTASTRAATSTDTVAATEPPAAAAAASLPSRNTTFDRCGKALPCTSIPAEEGVGDTQEGPRCVPPPRVSGCQPISLRRHRHVTDTSAVTA